MSNSTLEASAKGELEQLRRENRQLAEKWSSFIRSYDEGRKSSPMRQLHAVLQDVAVLECPINIHGESGSGKKYIARLLHERSSRRDRPFLVVNVAAVPVTLLGPILLGGLVQEAETIDSEGRGYLQLVAGGTLVLDGVSELSLDGQGRLLETIERHDHFRESQQRAGFQPRLISISRHSLAVLVRAGEFRSDLQERLATLAVEIPPLRRRRDEMPGLVVSILKQLAERYQRPLQQVSPSAMSKILESSWPENMRDLINCLERLVVTYPGALIEETDLLSTLSAPRPVDPLPRSLQSAVDACERDTILRFLEANQFHREKTAKALGISVRSLHYKIDRYDLRGASSLVRSPTFGNAP